MKLFSETLNHIIFNVSFNFKIPMTVSTNCISIVFSSLFVLTSSVDTKLIESLMDPHKVQYCGWEVHFIFFVSKHSPVVSNLQFEALPTGFPACITYVPHQAKVDPAITIAY